MKALNIPGIVACLFLLANCQQQANGPSAAASGTIRIGDINSLTADAIYGDNYKRGVEMALEEINARGGVLGRPLEVVWRDDQMDPAVAGRAAEDLVLREKCVMLAGTYASHTALAVANQAEHHRIPFLSIWGCTPAIVWEHGNPYTFMLVTNYDTEAAMLAQQAAKLPGRRWAAVAYNFEDGEKLLRAFQKYMKQLRPDVEWVAEQRPGYDKLEAGITINALNFHKPDALCTVIVSTDLAKFIREGKKRNFFSGKSVAAFWAGSPDTFNVVRGDIPAGWMVSGYAPEQVHEPAHLQWIQNYQKRYGSIPYGGSLGGYLGYHLMAQIINKAGSTNAEKIVAASEDYTMDSFLGPIHMRKADHQSTMGTWISQTARNSENGSATLTNCTYQSGAQYLPAEAEAAKWRPHSAHP